MQLVHKRSIALKQHHVVLQKRQNSLIEESDQHGLHIFEQHLLNNPFLAFSPVICQILCTQKFPDVFDPGPTIVVDIVFSQNGQHCVVVRSLVFAYEQESVVENLVRIPQSAG